MARFETTVRHVDDDSLQLPCVYEEVSVCPVCGHALLPQVLSGCCVQADKASDRFTVFILFFCRKCRNAFMVQYAAHASSQLIADQVIAIYPRVAPGRTFSEYISKLSPGFVEIYRQAEAAEALALNEVSGCGFRKALEFLVKDYLCHKDPDKINEIQTELLGASIKQIDDIRIQTLAQRAAWIGNDETHYIRKHEAFDIADMKRFISAMLHYVDSELAFEEALSFGSKSQACHTDPAPPVSPHPDSSTPPPVEPDLREDHSPDPLPPQ